MFECVCGLALFAVSAIGADLHTTYQFTNRGVRELNPIARPFVEGPGDGGELLLAVVVSAVTLRVEALESGTGTGGVALGVIGALHALSAARNHRSWASPDFPAIVFPTLVFRF